MKPQQPGHAAGWKWRKDLAGQVERPWAWSQINGGEDVPAHVGGLCESGWHSDCPQAPLQQPAGAGQCSCRCHYTREDRSMSTPTPEQFLAQPYDPDEDVEEAQETVLLGIDPMISMAQSLASIATTLGIPVAARDAQAADAHADEIRQLGEAYDDLEDKHRALYEVLADVEKIVAKSTSKVSLEVKAVINRWRNPVAEAEPAHVVVGEALDEPMSPAVQCPACERYFVDQERLDLHECTATAGPPANDAPVEAWRAYARSKGIDVSDRDNRSQIRTALGLPHFDAQA